MILCNNEEQLNTIKEMVSACSTKLISQVLLLDLKDARNVMPDESF